MDASNNLIAFYVYDGSGLVAKVTPTNDYYYYHYDGLGSTVAITDSTAQIVNAYAYSPYGLLGAQETIPNSFTYVGRFGVMAEGNGLYFMRARYYDPQVGRFINKDPIGYLGGMNLYAYAENDPVSLTDPLGFMSLWDRFVATMEKERQKSEALAKAIEEDCVEITYGVIPIGPLGGSLLASTRSAPRLIIRIKQLIGIHPYKVGAGGTLQPYNALTGRYIARSQTISGRLIDFFPLFIE